MKFAGIIKDIESLLRYIAPGYTLLCITFLHYPDTISDVPTSTLLLLAPFIGCAWYAVHRSALNIIDYPIYYTLGENIQSTIAANMGEKSKKERAYIYTRLANVHLAMIIGQQGIISYIYLHDRSNGPLIPYIAIFCIAFISYYLTLRECTRYDKNRRKDNANNGIERTR